MLLTRGLAALALPLLVASSTLFAACAAPADDDGAVTGSESAFTVERGDRFVVSASPERIVLSKKVNGVAFPFDERSLLGKAILIHPTKRAVTGVYARALSVTTEGDRYVVTSQPLTLGEMETIPESDIVRIFVEANPRRLSTSSIRPLAVASSAGVNGLTFNGYLGLSKPALLSPGITLTHTVDEASFDPDVLLDWTSERGLELGLRASLGWRSKLTIGGRAGGEFFRSATLASPPLVVTIPIGAALVPVTLSGSAFVACSALSTATAQIDVDVVASARVGGSFYVKPSWDTLPTGWVSEGTWKPEATGTGSVTSALAAAPGPTISCALPRIEVKALLAGAAGPYFAFSPVASMDGLTPRFQATLSAGVQANVLGTSRAFEVTLLTWKPGG